MPDGAVDRDFDEAERDPGEVLRDRLDDLDAPAHWELGEGDIALDLVTKQPLYVVGEAAPSVEAYFDDEGFDLATYSTHPWLPVRLEDRVFDCIFVPRDVERIHKISKTYSFPAGRLARVPLELALGPGGDD